MPIIKANIRSYCPTSLSCLIQMQKSFECLKKRRQKIIDEYFWHSTVQYGTPINYIIDLKPVNEHFRNIKSAFQAKIEWDQNAVSFKGSGCRTG